MVSARTDGSRISTVTRLIGALGLAWIAAGCTASQARDASPPPRHVDELAARLVACKVSELATGLAMDPQVGEVWRAFPDPAAYGQLVEDADRPQAVRFAAALMLRSTGELVRVNPHATAEVLAHALANDFAGYAFPWGTLWAPRAPLGELGQLMVELGKPAEPALAALLDDTTTRDAYLGRDESTVMAKRQYRVKDFAAFYLARIAHLELAWEPDLRRRDAAIAALRRRLTDLPAPAGAVP
ncbi:MAG TPA: hypothetical protein VGC42_15090 [Kofleriaceae bacterium]